MNKSLIVFAICLALLLIACDSDDGIKEYRVKKNPTGNKVSPKKHPSVTARPNEQQSKPLFSWQVPTGWSPRPTFGIRLANFAAGSQDNAPVCSVVLLGGDGGGLLANVNRWRVQMGLAAIDQAQLIEQSQELTVAGTKARMVDLTGVYRGMGVAQPQNNYRMLALSALTGKGALFVKMVGPDSIVGTEKSRFIDFCHSISPAGN